MSSCLCKQLEGAVFPLRTVLLKDRIENPVHALHVDETNHGTGAAANLHEAALDGVGGAQLAPQRVPRRPPAAASEQLTAT